MNMAFLKCSVCTALREFRAKILGDPVTQAARFVIKICEIGMPSHVLTVRVQMSQYAQEISDLDRMQLGCGSIDIMTAWICIQDLLRHLNSDNRSTISFGLLNSLVTSWCILNRIISIPIHRHYMWHNLRLRFPFCMRRKCKRADIVLWYGQYLTEYLDIVSPSRLECAERLLKYYSEKMQLLQNCEQLGQKFTEYESRPFVTLLLAFKSLLDERIARDRDRL